MISPEVAAEIARSYASDKQHHVFVVPTLVTYFAFAEDCETLGLGQDDRARLHGFVEKMGITEFQKAKLAALGKQAKKGLRTLKEAGVRVGFGTDLLGGLTEFETREFRIRREMYSDVELLKQATSGAAEILGMMGNGVGLKGERIGVVEEAALADLLLVEGNPLTDIVLLEDPKNIVTIMKDGRFWKKPAQ
jgi:imidazolonepropionase-like amidohydrolase